MNLSQLRFTAAVAETGSFSRAADHCCVTQPTLSNAVAQLEEELGERLFVRTTRKVALTDFGRHLLPEILEVLHSHDALLRKTREFLHPERRLIRVGTSPLINPRLLGLIIDPFRRRNPQV
ncbi:MAG: LysR family transcriptional regulator, partial [Nitrospirales bacterium]|nr:LysR family transcriptional regulator [Nitrospirales bacterium]